MADKGAPRSADRLRRQVRALLARGLAAFHNGEILEALAEWEHVLALDPNSLPARTYVSYINEHYDLLNEQVKDGHEELIKEGLPSLRAIGPELFSSPEIRLPESPSEPVFRSDSDTHKLSGETRRTLVGWPPVQPPKTAAPESAVQKAPEAAVAAPAVTTGKPDSGRLAAVLPRPEDDDLLELAGDPLASPSTEPPFDLGVQRLFGTGASGVEGRSDLAEFDENTRDLTDSIVDGFKAAPETRDLTPVPVLPGNGRISFGSSSSLDDAWASSGSIELPETRQRRQSGGAVPPRLPADFDSNSHTVADSGPPVFDGDSARPPESSHTVAQPLSSALESRDLEVGYVVPPVAPVIIEELPPSSNRDSEPLPPPVEFEIDKVDETVELPPPSALAPGDETEDSLSLSYESFSIDIPDDDESTAEPDDGLEPWERDLLRLVDEDAPPGESERERLRRRISALVEQARLEHDSGEYDLALRILEVAVAQEPDSVITQKQLQLHRESMSTIYQSYIGDTGVVPILAISLSELPNQRLDPRAAFLLSRIDGMMCFDEILDVSGMPRWEALRYLSTLLSQGILKRT